MTDKVVSINNARRREVTSTSHVPSSSTSRKQQKNSVKGRDLSPFLHKIDGLYFRIDDTMEKICSPLEVLAMTRDDESQNWGRQIKVVDNDGQAHQWALPMELLAGDGLDYRRTLLSMGLRIESGARAKNRLHDYLVSANPMKRARCVSRIGWHGSRFVLPDAVYGDTGDDEVILQGSSIDHAFRSAGSLHDWQENIGRLCPGNSRLVLAVSTAFAASLLAQTGMESGGFHLRGGTSCGKTTALKMAGSACGGGGLNGYLHQWRPDQRDKLQSWLSKTVLNLGEAGDTMDVILVGTVLHYDSVLSRLLANKLWRARKFQAVIEWPHRMDLWDRWEEVLLAEGEEAAQDYYRDRAQAMDEGAVVSWPSARPIYKLMVKRARDGHDAFDSEQQNDPLAGEGAPFATCITFWVKRRNDWMFFGAVDPSLGRSGAGRDPSAILVGGYSRERAVLDVVEASIRKRVPDRIIEDVLAFHAQYRCLLWAVESVQFQEFLRTELIRRAMVRGMTIPARAVTPISDKTLRIEAMQPYFAQGRIRVHSSQHTLIAQLRHFPKGDHEDGPDALEMLWQAATRGFTTMSFTAVPKGGGRSMIRRGHADDDD